MNQADTFERRTEQGSHAVLQEGFERGEKLFHVADGRQREAHLCACQDGGIDLETCATTDQLEAARWRKPICWTATSIGDRMIRRARAHGTLVTIEVEDSYGGIPEGAGDLFQPFGERRATDRSGLGLGLSIARRAVRAQGGDIEVCNTPGKGCTFVIEVPAAAELGLPDAVSQPAS